MHTNLKNITLFLIISWLICSSNYALTQAFKSRNLTDYVKPFIGTLGEGNVFVGACLPHGFVKLGPDTKYNSGASGYKNDKEILGFSHLHISGMGGPMYGNIQLTPTTGVIDPLNHSSAKGEETASPGNYKVALKKYNTKAELTSTAHVGFHKYTFPKSDTSHILIDVGATLYGVSQNWNSSQSVGGEIHIDALKKAVYGYGLYKGGRSTTKPWKVYFYAIFNTDFNSYGIWKKNDINENVNKIEGSNIGAFLNFITNNNQEILVKVGISMMDVENAEANIAKEIPDWNFENIVQNANDKWEDELRKIEVKGMSFENSTIFYTAFYHALLCPSDWTGQNPVFNNKRPYYEDFLCVWDIFRTVSPLLTLISTKTQVDMLNTLFDVYKHDGWLSDAHSSSQREFTQVGTNTDVLFADAYVKQLKGVDYRLAYEAVKKNATDTSFLNRKIVHAGRTALPFYTKYHYIPTDVNQKITVSRTLEYIYNDYCVYQLAKKYGTKAEKNIFKQRSFWYQNLWDDSLQLMRGKQMDGTWYTPFSPNKSETGVNFYEGHAYTWTYSTPHDVKGLINLFGNKEVFVKSLTNAVSNHYQAFNEPCMLQTYLFVWAGRPDLTQKFVRKAMDENFTNKNDGLPGNDDSGTTSAWYVWCRLGIFPVAGQNLYIIGSPSIAETTIHLESGKNIIISAKNASDKNIYIQSALLNGKPYNKAFFTHNDIVNGAKFEFTMGETPSNWGSNFVPPSFSDTVKQIED